MQREASGTTGSRPIPTEGPGAATRPQLGEATTTSAELGQAAAHRPDLSEFVAAFAVGAALGAGATLLLRREPKRGAAKIREDLAPYGKRVRQNTRSARRNFAAGADATSAAVEALGQAGRTLVRDLREEVAEIMDTARTDLAAAVNEQIGQTMKTLRRASRRKGRR